MPSTKAGHGGAVCTFCARAARHLLPKPVSPAMRCAREAVDSDARRVAARQPDAGQLGLGHVTESRVTLGAAEAFQDGIGEITREPDQTAGESEKQRKDGHGENSFGRKMFDSQISRNGVILTNTYRIAARLM